MTNSSFYFGYPLYLLHHNNGFAAFGNFKLETEPCLSLERLMMFLYLSRTRIDGREQMVIGFSFQV